MLVKFFKYGQGNGNSCFDYLLGKNRDRDHARVLSGDPELTRKLINNLKFSSKYTAGCLSFEEANTSEEKKKRIMEMFESSLFSNVGKENYDITWIEHLDKGRLELNFVIPKVHLGTGHQLHVYSHGADMKLTRSFKRLVNFEYGFSEPENNKRSLGLPNDIPKSVKEFREQIHQRIFEQVERGDFNSRDQIIRAINNSPKIKVQRVTKSSISILNPFGNKNIRLTGEIYSEKFNGENKNLDTEETKKMHVQGVLRKDYFKQKKLRAKRNSKRYKSVSSNFSLIQNKIASEKQIKLTADNVEPGLVTRFLLSDLEKKVKQHERDRKAATTKFKKDHGGIVRELGYYRKLNDGIKNGIRKLKQRAIKLTATIKRGLRDDAGLIRKQSKQKQITRGGNSIER